MFRLSLVLLILHFITVFCQDPILSIKQTEPPTVDGVIKATQAASVRLTCLVHNVRKGYTVRWQKKLFNAKTQKWGNSLKISEDEGVADNNKYSIEKPTENTWLLRVKSVGIEDEGQYQCYTQLSLITRKSAIVFIKVVVAPTLIPEKTSSDTTAKEGDNVDLNCNATGRPTPVVIWSRLGNKNLPGSIGKEKSIGSALNIKHVKPEDRGTYRCTVSNEIDTIKWDVLLSVKFSPIVSIQYPIVEQAVGYQIELQCFVIANPYPSVEQIGWFREKGARVQASDTGRVRVRMMYGAFNQLTYEIIFKKVEKEDYGRYTCRFTNSEGTKTGEIQLRETNTPQASVKLGRIISGVSNIMVSIATLLSCLLVGLLHYH